LSYQVFRVIATRLYTILYTIIPHRIEAETIIL